MTKSQGAAFLEQAKRGSIITKPVVRGLRLRWKFRPHRARSFDELEAEVAKFASKGPYRVDPEWEAAALAWWRKQLFRADGSLRDTQWMRDNNGSRAAKAIASFKRFEVLSFEWGYNYSGPYSMPFAIVRIVGGRDVPHYTYMQRGWQSGGNQEW